MQLLGLDIGDRRIGVAMGDLTIGLAVPVRVMTRGKVGQDAAAVAVLAREYEVDRIVVGLPLEADGSEGLQASRVRAYVRRLSSQLAYPFEFSDERFSTVDAIQLQRQAGRQEKQGRSTVDAAAAAVMLQAYLDRQPRPSI